MQAKKYVAVCSFHYSHFTSQSTDLAKVSPPGADNWERDWELVEDRRGGWELGDKRHERGDRRQGEWGAMVRTGKGGEERETGKYMSEKRDKMTYLQNLTGKREPEP